MMSGTYVDIDCTVPIWDRFYLVHPLVLVGTIEPDGRPDLAPKHMAGPVSWGNLFGFVCSERHATYRNAVRTGGFTVSYPGPDQVVMVSLAAAPREHDDSKPAIGVMPTIPAAVVDGPLLAGAHLHLECELDRTVDELEGNSLIIGRVVAAHIHDRALRQFDREDEDVLAAAPIMAYLQPNRFTAIERAQAFPFHAGWKR
jgi:flavin reductase (DIM6/NTAB) family NADH-FMN oxidoreductase RutF